MHKNSVKYTNDTWSLTEIGAEHLAAFFLYKCRSVDSIIIKTHHLIMTIHEMHCIN